MYDGGKLVFNRAKGCLGEDGEGSCVKVSLRSHLVTRIVPSTLKLWEGGSKRWEREDGRVGDREGRGGREAGREGMWFKE